MNEKWIRIPFKDGEKLLRVSEINKVETLHGETWIFTGNKFMGEGFVTPLTLEQIHSMFLN